LRTLGCQAVSVCTPVTFSWDYFAFPVWWRDDDDDSVLPEELKAALQSWSDEGTRTYMDLGPTCTPPDGWLPDWVARGRDLALETARYVGPVDYLNELTKTNERIEPPG